MASSPSELRNITTQRRFAKAYRLCLLQMAAPAKPRQNSPSIKHSLLRITNANPRSISSDRLSARVRIRRAQVPRGSFYHALHALHDLHSLSAIGDKAPSCQLVDGCSCSSTRQAFGSRCHATAESGCLLVGKAPDRPWKFR